MQRALILSAVLAVSSALHGCGDASLEVSGGSGGEHAADSSRRTSALHDAEFVAAGSEFDVPPALLKALSWVQTGYQMVTGEQEFEGQVKLSGLMALGGPALERGARLSGVTVEAAKTEPLANVRASAALLRAIADEQGIDRRQVREFAPVVAAMSGLTQSEARASFVRDEVFRALKQGMGAPSAALVSSGQSLDVQGELGTLRQPLSAPDFGGALWRPSPNYDSRTAGPVSTVVIHTCEGSYSSCWNWLRDPNAGASAHYVVNSDGSEITQLVREQHRAWHVGAAHNCHLRGGVDCDRNGVNVNHLSVGIEHAGFASQTWFAQGQLDASAKLVCNITARHGIPRDRHHIVGHGTVQPYDRTDPGPNWPWADYLAKVNRSCNTPVIAPEATRFEHDGQWIKGFGAPDWAATGDFNGDGKDDVIWYEGWNAGGATVALSNGNGFDVAGQWIKGFGAPDWAAVGDFNGDGRDDIIWYEGWNNSGATVLLSTGNGFTVAGQWIKGFGAPDWAAVGDFDGDGKDDVIWYEHWNRAGATVALSNGDGFGIAGQWFTGFGRPDFAAVGDLNGDGRDDVLWYEAWNNAGGTAVLSTGSGFSAAGQWFTGFGKPTWASLRDFNGDGRADLAWYEHWNQGGVTVITSSGSDFTGPSKWLTGWGAPDLGLAGDFNGDKRADLGWYEVWNSHGLSIGLAR